MRLSMRESTMLRRRRSFLDSHRSNANISFFGEVKGMVITRPPSARGHPRTHHHTARFRIDDDSSNTEVADEYTSDFGTLRGNDTNSQASLSPMPSPRRSFKSLRTPKHHPPLARRKFASSYNLHHRPEVPSRAKSMPVSPVVTPAELPSALKQSISEALDQSYFGDHPTYPTREDGSAWGTLKRNLSFARPRSGVFDVDLSDSLPEGRPARESRDAVMEKTTPPDGADSPSLEERPGGLLRRKSSKLFKSLSKLTPFESIST